MEEVLYNTDLLSYISGFIPLVNCVYLNSICKNIRFDSEKFNCSCCKNNKLFLPIQKENKLYCYDCLESEYLKSNHKLFDIDKDDITNWKFIEKDKKKKCVKCKYCDIKCTSYEFLHYHLINKCEIYTNNLEKFI